MTAKKSTKAGKNFRGERGGEIFFWLARIYTPALLISSFESVNFTTDCFFTIHTSKPSPSQATFLTSRLPQVFELQCTLYCCPKLSCYASTYRFLRSPCFTVKRHTYTRIAWHMVNQVINNHSEKPFNIIYLSIYLSVYLSICLSIYLSIYRQFELIA